MTPDHLPAELEKWPTDSWSILGVDERISPRELKRVYTRLIRIYKPEQFPEQFRRIRAAYEDAARYAAWNGEGVDSEAEETHEPEQPSAETKHEEPIAGWPADHRAPTFDKQLSTIWDFACRGQEQSAYDQLLEMLRMRPGDPDLCIRLYWLLKTTPDLDPHRTPSDWLVAGLVASNLTGPLRELYRREMLARPSEAVSDRFKRLWAASCHPGSLVSLFEERWQAAAVAESQFPRIVAEDLGLLRPRISNDDDELWMRLLVLALDYLVWADGETPRELALNCRRELEAAVHLHRQLANEIDRMEISWEMAKAWQQLQGTRKVSTELLTLLRSVRTYPIHEVRRQLENFIDPNRGSPASALRELSSVSAVSNQAVMAFGQAVDNWGGFLTLPNDVRSDEELDRINRDLLLRVDFLDYNVGRFQLLDHCLENWIAPERVASWLSTISDEGSLEFAHQLDGDVALHCVCRAYRYFWA